MDSIEEAHRLLDYFEAERNLSKKEAAAVCWLTLQALEAAYEQERKNARDN